MANARRLGKPVIFKHATTLALAAFQLIGYLRLCQPFYVFYPQSATTLGSVAFLLAVVVEPGKCNLLGDIVNAVDAATHWGGRSQQIVDPQW